MTDPKLQRDDDDDEPFDPERRVLCDDGLCVGVIGPDGRIAKVWPKVKVPGHAEEVLAAAKALSKPV